MQTIHNYVVKMLEATEKTRVIHAFDEYDKIKAHFAEKAIDMQSELTKDIEEEILAVFVEEYIHHYEYKNPNMTGFVSVTSERKRQEIHRQDFFNVIKNFDNSKGCYQDLMYFLHVEQVVLSPMEGDIVVTKEDLDFVNRTIGNVDVFLCTHEETDSKFISFIGTYATGGSFGFEFTQGYWNHYVRELYREEHGRELARQSGAEMHMWAEELLANLEAEESFVLNAASQLGIVEGRDITFEAIEIQLNNNKVLRELFEDLTPSEIQCLVHYSLDCLNAKCRENGDPEIY